MLTGGVGEQGYGFAVGRVAECILLSVGATVVEDKNNQVPSSLLYKDAASPLLAGDAYSHVKMLRMNMNGDA